jgi:hypothetical protein
LEEDEMQRSHVFGVALAIALMVPVLGMTAAPASAFTVTVDAHVGPQVVVAQPAPRERVVIERREVVRPVRYVEVEREHGRGHHYGHRGGRHYEVVREVEEVRYVRHR